jgi:hypothetical protein
MMIIIAQAVWFNPCVVSNMSLVIVNEAQAFLLQRDSVTGSDTWQRCCARAALAKLLTVDVPRLYNQHVHTSEVPTKVKQWLDTADRTSVGATAWYHMAHQASLCAGMITAVKVIPQLPLEAPSDE